MNMHHTHYRRALKQVFNLLKKVEEGCYNVRHESDCHEDAKSLAREVMKDCRPHIERLKILLNREVDGSIENLVSEDNLPKLDTTAPAQITHGERCWSWGPAHYECACTEISRRMGWKK